MGARINFLFNEGDDKPAVWLYSHWGADSWEEDLASAIWMARSRWDDTSYAVRIIVSQLIGNQWQQSSGFGLGAVAKPKDFLSWEPTIIIDMVDKIVDGHGFEKFCRYHLVGDIDSLELPTYAAS